MSPHRRFSRRRAAADGVKAKTGQSGRHRESRDPMCPVFVYTNRASAPSLFAAKAKPSQSQPIWSPIRARRFVTHFGGGAAELLRDAAGEGGGDGGELHGVALLLLSPPLLDPQADAPENGEGLLGMLPHGRLAGEHQRVGPLPDRLGDVGHLGPGGRGVLDHGLEELRRHDDGPVEPPAELHDPVLGRRDLLQRDLGAQVPASHHGSVRRPDDVLQVLQRVNALDLRDHRDLTGGGGRGRRRGSTGRPDESREPSCSKKPKKKKNEKKREADF